MTPTMKEYRMSNEIDRNKVTAEQYATAENLNARSQVHALYSTNKYGWTRWVFDQFEFPDGARILELGCGNGGLWASNLQRIHKSWEVTLSDMSPGMLEEARRNLAAVAAKFSFVVADAQEMPFPDSHFDAVIANHMLYCLPDVDRGIAGIRRVLKPNGRVFATTNGSDHMRELRDLVQPLAPELPFVTQDNADAFSLENGHVKLERHFRHVEQLRYEDALDVTAAEPLLAWLMSVRRAKELLSDKVETLKDALAAVLAREGRILVTKSPGLFIGSC